MDAWQAAYLAQIDAWADRTQGRILNTVFFGGGTPSLMPASLVDAIMDRIRARWSLANDFEATLEANPTSVDASKFAAFRMAGINRVSLGIQALNNNDLRALGRMHDVDEALAAFDIARAAFDRVSFDLIYARQGQTLPMWEAELRRALDMAIDHLSLYQLTVEPGTVFAQRQARGGLRGLPGDDAAADMYDVTTDICRDYGFHGYEVSNYARPGSESQHNLIYWRYGDYIGIGPGAHGRITDLCGRRATEAPRDPAQWLAIAQNGYGCDEAPLSPIDCAQEYLMMSLRLTEGCDRVRLQAMIGSEFNGDALRDLVQMGMIECTDTHIRATPDGRLVLNAVVSKLFEDLQ